MGNSYLLGNAYTLDIILKNALLKVKRFLYKTNSYITYLDFIIFRVSIV
jgi:hypothetical protein